MMSIFIGLTGLPGSGKGTMVTLFEERIRELGFHCYSHSLSDEIRYQLQEKGLHITRESLTQHANELRNTYGHGILAQLVMKRMKRDFEMYASVPDIVLIDSIRNPGEVNEFRAILGSRFSLLAVLATEKTIETRFRTRQREEESTKNLTALLRAELGGSNPNFGLRIGECIEMADWQISNDGSEQNLREKISKMVDEQVFPLLENSSG